MNENNIAFSISLDNFIKASKSSHSAQNVVVKLTKKNGNPFLSFVIDFHQKEFKTVTQDVPIVLLSAQNLNEMSEPTLEDPEVHISLPKPLSKIKPVIERMKNIGDTLTVEANMDGMLKLRVETDMVTVMTTYKDLDHPQMEGKSPIVKDPHKKCVIRVNAKKFSSFLASTSIEPEVIVMCLVPDRAIVLHVLAGEESDMFMTYYIPIMVSD